MVMRERERERVRKRTNTRTVSTVYAFSLLPAVSFKSSSGFATRF